jgi:transposase
MSEGITETIGCDLGDKTSELCFLGLDGRVSRIETVKTTKRAMRHALSVEPRRVVMEVGAHSRWVSELARQLGHQVTVANARRLQLISKNDSKNDRSDAELLARLGRADLKLLAPVKHRGSAAQAELAVAKVRDGLVRTRTQLINMARGLVKSFGHRFSTCSAECFHRKNQNEIPEELKPAIEPIFTMLESVDTQIEKLDEEIARLAAKHPDVEVLAQPSGVGVLTALDHRGQDAISEQPTRRGLSRPAATTGSIRRQRQTAADNQGRGSISSPAAGELREPNPQQQREGQRSPKMGTRAGASRRKERQEASCRRGRAKVGGADASALGDRRGVRALEKQHQARRVVGTGATKKRQENPAARTDKRNSQEKTRTAPSGRLRSAPRALKLAPQIAAPRRFGPQHAPGTAMPQPECEWKRGGVVSRERSEVGLDFEGPLHGRGTAEHRNPSSSVGIRPTAPG